MNDKTIGQRIKAARQRAGLSQAELADKIGRPYQSVGQWERDMRSPKFSSLEEIADALGISIEELICSDKPETRNSKPLFDSQTLLETEQLSPDSLHDFIYNILQNVSNDLESLDSRRYRIWASTIRPMLEEKIREEIHKIQPKDVKPKNTGRLKYSDEFVPIDRVIAIKVEEIFSLILPTSEISEAEINEYFLSKGKLLQFFSSEGLRMLASTEGIDNTLYCLGQFILLKKDIKRRND